LRDKAVALDTQEGDVDSKTTSDNFGFNVRAKPVKEKSISILSEMDKDLINS